MKNKFKILLSTAIWILLFVIAGKAQSVNVQQSDRDTSIIDSQSETIPPDSLMPQTVTIDTGSVSKPAENVSASYRPSEKIHIYSGNYEGNNIIKIVEIPLPENSSSRGGDFTPH